MARLSLTELRSAEYTQQLLRCLREGWGGHRIVERRTRGFEWLLVAPQHNFPKEGWKLHVSVSAAGAAWIPTTLLPILCMHEVAFKLPRTLQGLLRLNAGLAGETQIGKIVTVYPRTDQVLNSLIENLLQIEAPEYPGPVVPSDLAVANSGHLFVRYGSFQGTGQGFDSLGRPNVLIDAAGGAVDVRSIDGSQAVGSAACPVRTRERTIGDATACLQIQGREYLPLRLLHKSAKGRVELALDMVSIRTVVVKRANYGVLGDVLGRDALERLGNEANSLRMVAHLGIAPKMLAHDEVSGTVVMEDVGGRDLSLLKRSEVIPLLPQVARVVAALHAEGFVHRDLKLANIIVSLGQIFLIDFELASHAGSSEPINSGTAGHLDEFYGGRTDDAQDSYAVGSMLFHAVTGVHPAKLPINGPSDRMVSLLQATRCLAAASLVKCLQHPDAQHRIRICDLPDVLEQKVPEIKEEARRLHLSQPGVADREAVRYLVKGAALHTRNFRIDEGACCAWRNEHLHPDHLMEGINLGAAGVVLGLATIADTLHVEDYDNDIYCGAAWLARRQPSHAAHGFFTGNSGTAVTLIACGLRFGQPKWVELGLLRLRMAEDVCEDNDLFSGRAGVLWGSTCAALMLNDITIARRVAPMAHALIKDSLKDKHGTSWKSGRAFDPRGLTYYGVAHGATGIAAALCVWASLVEDPLVESASEEALWAAYLRARDMLSDDRVIANDLGATKHASVWCHGALGLLWAACASGSGKTQEIGNLAWKLIANAPPPLFNPTICHGMAGSLEALRVAQAASVMIPAGAVEQQANLLALLAVDDGRGVFWQSEDSDNISPDLWVGFLGPATTLAMWLGQRTDAVLSPAWFKTIARS